MDRKILWSYRKRRSTKKQTFIEKPITQTIKAYQDPNIQIPMVVASYRTPSKREARVLDFISSYLSDGRFEIIQESRRRKRSPYK
jgi:hypothetical protein